MMDARLKPAHDESTTGRRIAARFPLTNETPACPRAIPPGSNITAVRPDA
jgi:hypothetical protein